MSSTLFSFQGILIILVVLLLWLIAISFFLWQLGRHYLKLTAGITRKDLKSVLEEILNQVEENRRGLDKLEKKAQSLKEDGEYHLQKIGFRRYNPFKSTGGDQSFILSILDNHNNGIVMTSLHSRETTRVYGKKIIGGEKEKYELSDEERKVISEAIKGKNI